MKRLFVFFEGLMDPFPDYTAKQPPDKFLGFVWFYTRPHWVWMLLLAVLTALISILEVSLFGYLGNLVDWLSSADRNTFLADERGKLIWIGFLILILLPFVGLMQSVVVHQTVIGNYPMAIRWLMHRHMLGQSYAFFQDEFAGRVSTKVMQTALGVREAVMKVLDVLVYVLVYFLAALFLLASFDTWLIVPFLLWVVGYVLLMRLFLPKLETISRLQADARSDMTGRVVDSYTNIMTVKLFAHSGREAQYARESMQGFLGTVHPQMQLVTELNFFLSLLNGLLLFSVGATSVGLWLGSSISVGAVAVGVGLVLRLQGMSQWIMWELSNLFESIGVVFDGMEMLSRKTEVQDKPDATELLVSRGEISFEKVRFHYGKEAGAFESLDLRIKPGEKIGLVGRSGAGKTTLTNLLLRLYDVESGCIRIDGQDISVVTQESLRQQIGVVTQDSALLHRSVFDNIAYGNPDATQQAVDQAAMRANASEFIGDLVDAKGRLGYQAQVGERGVKLSGGQRQRIAIARMFLKNAPVLVLDEATSALDSEVEAAIQENLASLMDGKTVIAIAHRLSTIAMMDRLIVLDQGRIVEQGTHDQLINNGALYAQLWRRQSGGFLAEP